MNKFHFFKLIRRVRKRLARAFHFFTAATTLAVFSLILTACNLDRLGDFLMDQCQYSCAVPCYEVMTLVESGCGTKSERLANAWTNLGICYAKLSRDTDAVKVENLAVQMRRKILESQT